MRDTQPVWDWVTGAKMSRRRAWLEGIIGGSIQAGLGIAFLIVESDTTLKLAFALWIAVGLRWIIPGIIRLRKRDD